MKPKLSLVFPCWHAAQHMPHVLEDLQAQTFKDFEAILVNDGDDSQVEAMEKIAVQDSRIRIIHRKQNGGVVAARKSGINAVSTKWVTYPDPDDRFGPNYARSLYEAVDNNDVEMACGGSVTLDVGNDIYTYNHIEAGQPFEITDVIHGYERIWAANVHQPIWNKLYSVEIIRRYALFENIQSVFGEDDIFNMRFLTFVKKIGLVKDCEYIYYRYSENTITSRYTPNEVQVRLYNSDLREKLHQMLGWSEPRILEVKNKELAYGTIKTIRHFYASNSPLTINGVTEKIRTEILSEPKLVNAILAIDFGKDRLMLLLQRLIRKGNARLIAVSFKILICGKEHFGNLYKKVKPFFRGEYR